jgi:hypothetical protein
MITEDRLYLLEHWRATGVLAEDAISELVTAYRAQAAELAQVRASIGIASGLGADAEPHAALHALTAIIVQLKAELDQAYPLCDCGHAYAIHTADGCDYCAQCIGYTRGAQVWPVEDDLHAHLRARAERAEAERDELCAMLAEFVTCPHDFDPATIPRAGKDAAPEQVVMEFSIGYVWYKAARALLARIAEGGAA